MRIIEPAKLISETVKESVLPHLVAIYDDRGDQRGSAFLTMWNGNQLLVTAKHCLFGHKFNEKPATKSIFDGNELRSLDVVARSQVACNQELDIAVVHVEGFASNRALPYSALQFNEPALGMVSIVGYLARDHRRSLLDSTLRPKPFCHTDVAVDVGPELVGVKYQNRVIATKSGQRELSPIPLGLSGGPMLDASALVLNQVKVCGVFTEERLSEGYVFGTHISALAALMQSLLEP
ncbi:trypsin-like peptidase domain-containing protein [Mesorhizobium sp. M0589]|uniref:trypsin-like peptidase domain-containing protein n=1 Tax=Mesorhizobium sp. M0589 TaxID=2956965 RepID=UPI00333DCA01